MLAWIYFNSWRRPLSLLFPPSLLKIPHFHSKRNCSWSAFNWNLPLWDFSHKFIYQSWRSEFRLIELISVSWGKNKEIKNPILPMSGFDSSFNLAEHASIKRSMRTNCSLLCGKCSHRKELHSAYHCVIALGNIRWDVCHCDCPPENSAACFLPLLFRPGFLN